MSVDIFISYRRGDDPGTAGRVFDRLKGAIGGDHIFMDVVTIEPAADFHQAIAEALKQCSYFLALIGPRWLSGADGSGSRRIDDPGDFVRQEIAAALKKVDCTSFRSCATGRRCPPRTSFPLTFEDLRG